MNPSPLNVATHLARMAADHPTQVAIHFPRRGVKPEGTSEHIAVTFAELNADADAIAHGLVAAGIVRGTRTALMVPPSPNFFALTFALFKIAAVPVLIDPGMGIRNLGKCLADAEPEAFIGIAKANAARRVLGWGKKTIRTTVNAGRWRFFTKHSLSKLRAIGKSRAAYPIPDVAPDEPAAVLFTSGSTGIAKGAEYTHGIFAAQVDSLKATYAIEPGEIDLCTFPLFALFGPALGMTCVIPDMNPTRPAQLDPRKAVAQIKQFSVTNMFGSPAVVRRLGDFACERRGVSPTVEPSNSPMVEEPNRRAHASTLTTLRRVISAGAPASAASLERFVKLLPDTAQVFTPYGATEALPVANIGSREILGETRKLTEQGKGVCVGRPVAGMEVYVIPICDEPIPEWSDSLQLPAGEIGEFVVRGPVVTKQYFNRPEATKLAKLVDLKTGDILHRMGDVGYIDETGRLWFCGRKSHRVVTPHGTLFTDMVEPIFNTVLGVSRTALVGVRRNGVTYPVLCVECLPPMWKMTPWSLGLVEPHLREVGAGFDPTRCITTFLQHSGFPVDVRHNSKIFREKLTAWADKQLGPNWKPEAAT
ncbi:MAG: AMP-binding protein [Planctomycetes bacterium]|nr:AMP-binding protein [Planctomycetota bacterium]